MSKPKKPKHRKRIKWGVVNFDKQRYIGVNGLMDWTNDRKTAETMALMIGGSVVDADKFAASWCPGTRERGSNAK